MKLFVPSVLSSSGLLILRYVDDFIVYTLGHMHYFLVKVGKQISLSPIGLILMIQQESRCYKYNCNCSSLNLGLDVDSYGTTCSWWTTTNDQSRKLLIQCSDYLSHCPSVSMAQGSKLNTINATLKTPQRWVTIYPTKKPIKIIIQVRIKLITIITPTTIASTLDCHADV